MKPARQNTPKARRCRGCPYRAPKGRCLDPVIKSGRCGLYVWYVRGGKQCRHVYIKPQDPRTPKQLRWRARFGAASKDYSHSLTEEQRDACIAAGAKLRSRPRLNQSGPLTGQQYSIRKEYAENAEGRMENAEAAPQVTKPQRLTRSTSGTHRGIPVTPPGQSRRGRASKKEGRRKSVECSGQKGMANSQMRQMQRVTRSRWGRYRSTARLNESGQRLTRLPVRNAGLRWPRSRWVPPNDGFSPRCFIFLRRKWWRRRELNPRPWQSCQPRLHA
jgi:hypothetical protein